MSFKFEIGQELVLARDLYCDDCLILTAGARVLVVSRKERFHYTGKELSKKRMNRYRINWTFLKNDNLQNVCTYTFVWEDDLVRATKSMKNNYY